MRLLSKSSSRTPNAHSRADIYFSSFSSCSSPQPLNLFLPRLFTRSVFPNPWLFLTAWKKRGYSTGNINLHDARHMPKLSFNPCLPPRSIFVHECSRRAKPKRLPIHLGSSTVALEPAPWVFRLKPSRRSCWYVLEPKCPECLLRRDV